MRLHDLIKILRLKFCKVSSPHFPFILSSKLNSFFSPLMCAVHRKCRVNANNDSLFFFGILWCFSKFTLVRTLFEICFVTYWKSFTRVLNFSTFFLLFRFLYKFEFIYTFNGQETKQKLSCWKWFSIKIFVCHYTKV